MILRRFMKHVSDQNWFAVGLDVCVVIVGIFLGMQVTEWQSRIKETHTARENAERLLLDLQQDLRNWRAIIGYYDQVYASGEKAIQLLNSSDVVADELVFHAYRATEYIAYPHTSATWDEMIANGEVDLLPQDHLRADLTWLFALDVSTEAFEVLSLAPYRSRVRRIVPHSLQVVLRNKCSDVIEEGQPRGLVEQCDLRSQAELVGSTATALRKDTELVKDLNLHLGNLNLVRVNFTGQIIKLADVVERLNAALKERP